MAKKREMNLMVSMNQPPKSLLFPISSLRNFPSLMSALPSQQPVVFQ